MRQHKLKIALGICLSLICTSAVASDSSVQGHLRLGLVNGSFTGAVDGGFSVSTSLEGEGEYLYSSRLSTLARATVSLEGSSGQFKYIYMGLGQRYYLFSRNGAIESNHDGISIEINPRVRYYIEALLGLSQVQVKAVTSTLVAQSTLLEYGGGLGAIYQISKGIGLEGSVGVSKGFAVSSVAVDSLIIRALVGVVSTF
ncbi:MAG: hypothetical protein ACXVA9_09590 [Bdellovibrionales bacterium]